MINTTRQVNIKAIILDCKIPYLAQKVDSVYLIRQVPYSKLYGDKVTILSN